VRLVQSELVVRESDDQELQKQTPAKHSEVHSTAQSSSKKTKKKKLVPKQEVKSIIYAEDIRDAQAREKEKIR